MNAQPRGNRDVVLATFTIAFLVLSSGAPAASAQEQTSIGERFWPSENLDRPEDMVSLANTTLNVTSALIVGKGPFEAFRIERLNNTASRIAIQEQSGPNQSFVQAHGTPRVSKATFSGGVEGQEVELFVAPSQLHPTIEVFPAGTNKVAGVKVLGPPGSFDVPGETPKDKARHLFETMGLPPLRPGSESNGSYTQLETTNTGLYTGRLYGEPDQVCTEREDGRCTEKTGLAFECRGCKTWSYKVHPHPAEELTRSVGGAISVRQLDWNEASLWFDPEGRMISFSAGPALDLNTSQVIDPLQARTLVVDDIDQRGYRLGRLSDPEPRNASSIDEAQLEFILSEGLIEPVGARYTWKDIPVIDPPEEGSDDPYGDSLLAEYVQNAVNGSIVKATFRPASTASGPDNPLPAPGLGLVLAAGAAAALAWRRRD